MAKTKKEESIVDVAKKRYERARDFYNNPRQLALEDTRFAMGDSDNGWQWPAEVYRDRNNINKKPCLTINVTAQHCNQIINNIRQNRPSARVIPVDGKADKKTAEIIGGMIRSIQAISSADTAHDLAAEHAIYGGEGYWRVITDYESYDSFNQVILIKPIANPRLVYIDPDAKEPDRSDAKWGFIFEDIPKDQCDEDYPDIDCSSWAEDQRGWVTKDNIRIAEYFYCTYEPETLYLLENAQVIVESDIPPGVEIRAKEKLALVDGIPLAIVQERKTERKQWKWCKLIGGEDRPVEERDWPGSYLPIITVVGKELNVDGEIVRKGIVRDLKDPARMVNYSYSAAVETVALQTKTPYLASAEALEGFEDIWGASNLENRAYLPWNAYDEEGRQLPPPVKANPAQMATAQVQMLQLSTEEMRAASGQQNANFGIKSEAQSGVGIQRLKVQGETATFHFPDNLVRALSYEAKVLIDLIPKVYDAPRIVRILGLDGQESPAQLDPTMQQAHAQILEGEVKEVFNPTVGKYDVTIDTGPSFQTQRQEAASALTELATKYPPLMQVAGDLVVRSYDFPGADEIAKRIEKTLPPNLRDEEGQDPQVQIQQMGQQLQQAEQAIQQMAQQLEQLEMEKQAKVIEGQTKLAEIEIQEAAETERESRRLAVDEYKAETERLKALEPVMTEEALRPIVENLLIEVMTTPIEMEEQILPQSGDVSQNEIIMEPEIQAEGLDNGNLRPNNETPSI